MSVQWLGLSAFTAVVQVQSLVGELKSWEPYGVVKKKEKERENFKGSGVYNKKLHISVTIRKYFYVESSILRHVLVVDNIQLVVIDKGHFKA